MSMGQTLVMYKQMKNGKWRLYKSEQQAITAWRGTNDKVTTIRSMSGNILNFNTKEEAIEFAKKHLNNSAYEWSES